MNPHKVKGVNATDHGSVPTRKGQRHAKFAGNFGEVLVLFWLSKHGFECAWVDHVGIDIIAVHESGAKFGISVKARTQAAKNPAVDIYRADFAKAEKICALFDCAPYLAIVSDETSIGGTLSMFLVPLHRAKELMGFCVSKDRNKQVKYPNWHTGDEWRKKYRKDEDVLVVEFDGAEHDYAQELEEWWKNHSRPTSP